MNIEALILNALKSRGYRLSNFCSALDFADSASKWTWGFNDPPSHNELFAFYENYNEQYPKEHAPAYKIVQVQYTNTYGWPKEATIKLLGIDAEETLTPKLCRLALGILGRTTGLVTDMPKEFLTAFMMLSPQARKKWHTNPKTHTYRIYRNSARKLG